MREQEDLLEHNTNLQESISQFNRLAFGRLGNKSKSKEKLTTSTTGVGSLKIQSQLSKKKSSSGKSKGKVNKLEEEKMYN